MHRATFRRTQRFILWLGLLPLLLAWFAYSTSSAHVRSVEATLATQHFIRNLDELLSAIQDAETGQRGYLLTGQDRYLDPFHHALAILPKQLASLDTLAAANGVSPRQISQLRVLIDQKVSELELTIHLRQKSVQAAVAEVNTNRGQQYMVEIRSLITTVKDQQLADFNRRLARERRSQVELDVVLALGILVSFLLVYLAHRFNIAYALERDRIEREVRSLNESLEAHVKERTAELESRTKELEKRSADLERSNADLTQFAYVASHDLQEPLRMVASYVGLLSRRFKDKLDETADLYIKFAVDGVTRMHALIQDLLTYSRTGTQALEKRPVSSEAIVQTALRNLDASVRETGAIVRYENLPVIAADELKLTQLMQNLIGNAIKFRKPDQRPEVSITAESKQGEWLFAVSDNGIGFDPAYRDRIFQIFQRLHIDEYPGTGIGLAICRRIVELHGGKLWAESELGAGSTFFFTLPDDLRDDRPG